MTELLATNLSLLVDERSRNDHHGRRLRRDRTGGEEQHEQPLAGRSEINHVVAIDKGC